MIVQQILCTLAVLSDVWRAFLFALQSNYDKMKSEVPKYKMITPSILADRLRVSRS